MLFFFKKSNKKLQCNPIQIVHFTILTVLYNGLERQLT